MSVLKPAGEAPPAPGVYLLYKGGHLVYVGQTKNLRRRLVDLDHRKADQFYLLPVDDRKEVEAALLSALDPVGNDRGCPNPAEFRVYDGHRKWGCRLNMRISPDLAADLHRLAAKDGRRLSDQVRWILRGAVERSEPGGRHSRRAAAGRES
jgi:hypothetical protein